MLIPNPETFRQNLLGWYTAHQRDLPWRHTDDPYRIWLAEIMLQQTTVATVLTYYHKFLTAFPTVQDLAKAELEDVLHLWQGLGYYSRARNLHTCAQVVVAEHNGHFPDTEIELLNLPRIGPYTAAAIAAQAFNQPAAVVDGNVERVISRLVQMDTPLPKAKPKIKQLAETLSGPQTACRLHQRHYGTGCLGVYTEKTIVFGVPCTRPLCQPNTRGGPALPHLNPRKPNDRKKPAMFILSSTVPGIFILQQRPHAGC